MALDIPILQKCRLFHIYPKFLDFNWVSRPDFQETWACLRFKEDLLNYELREKKSLRLKYKKSYVTARCRLQETLSPLDLNHTCSTIEAKSSKLKDRLSKKLDKKFNVLKRKKGILQLSNLDNDSIIFQLFASCVNGNREKCSGKRFKFLSTTKKCWQIWGQKFFRTAISLSKKTRTHSDGFKTRIG